MCALMAVVLNKVYQLQQIKYQCTPPLLLSCLPTDALQLRSCAQFSKQPQDCAIYRWIRYYKKTMSDYGKILKYQEKYRETDISVDPYLKDILQKLETLSVVIILHLNP